MAIIAFKKAFSVFSFGFSHYYDTEGGQLGHGRGDDAEEKLRSGVAEKEGGRETDGILKYQVNIAIFPSMTLAEKENIIYFIIHNFISQSVRSRLTLYCW